jgi:CheY-like chemotaxis protein
MHPATVVSTFSVDGPAASLPSFADWLVHATTGRLIVERRSEDLYDLSIAHAVPAPGEREESVTVQLVPGAGLVAPAGGLSRRGHDRPGVDVNRLLLISLGGTHAADLDLWARGAFQADVVTEPFEAIARVQADASFGGVLVYASRTGVREAVTACRALRPLTRAAIVFASDDAVRSTDRVHILEAGADDCLTGGLDFRELGLRIRQAVQHGSKPAPAASHPGGNGFEGGGGRVPPDRFREELRRRAANPVSRYFCVLDVSPGSLTPAVVEQILVEQVRADAGDLVTTDSNRCAVLLQGAREGQLATFLDRLRARLRERLGAQAHGEEPAVQVLSHPAESTRIRSLLDR